MAQASKSFSDYYAEALSKQPAAPSAQPIVRKKLVVNKGTGDKAKANKPNNPISWLLDMVSRPLYAVTNTVDAAMNAGSKERQQERADLFDKGDVLGGLGAIAGDVGDVVSAPVRGLLSTDKKDKHLASDLIEKGTDTVGAFNPDYKDVEDNVNPWVKGGFGLAGDIALDPLTYVPIAGIVAAGSKIAKAAKGGAAIAGGATKAVSDGIRTAREAKAAEKLAVDAVDVGESVPVAAPAKAAEATDLAPIVPEQAVVPDLPVAPKELPVAAAAAPAPVLPDAPSAQLAAANKLPAANSFLDTLKTPIAATTGPDWSKFPGGKMPSVNQWFLNMAREAPKAKLVLIGRDTPNPAEVLALLKDKNLPAATRTSIQDQLDVGYEEWQMRIGKQLPQLSVEATTRQMGTFQQIIKDANVRAEAERALGPELVGWLARKRNPNSFDKTINEVKNILENGAQLDNIIDASKMSTVMRSLMTHMGVDVVETNKNIKALSGESKVAPANPVTPEDMLGKMDTTAEERLATLDQDAQDLLADLPGPISKNFGKAYDIHTKTGIARDSKDFAMGLGRAEKVFNQYVQWDIHQSVMARVITRVDKAIANDEIKGGPVPRALAIKEEMTRKMALLSDMFDQEGYQMYLGIKENAVPLNISQMYGILDDVGGAGNTAESMLKYVYNTSTRAPTTNIMDALVHAAEGATRDVIRADLANTLKRNVSPAHMLPDGTVKPDFAEYYRLPNPLVDKGSKRIFGFIPNTGRGAPKRVTPGVTYVPKGNGGWYRVYDSDHLLDELTDTIMGAGPEVQRVSAANAAALKARGASEISELTTKEIETLLMKTQDPERLGEALRQAGNIDKSIAKSVRDSGSLGTSEIATKAAVAKLVDQDVADSAKSIVAAGDKARQAGKPANTAGKSPEQADRAVQKAGRAENQ
jgi:hypothetical protein